jgi:hypothetical protein
MPLPLPLPLPHIVRTGYAQGMSRRVCRCLCRSRGMHRASIGYITCVASAAASTAASATDRDMHRARKGYKTVNQLCTGIATQTLCAVVWRADRVHCLMYVTL